MSSLAHVLPPMTDQRSSRLLASTSQPIPLLATPLANGYGYACTAGTLFYYYLRAGSLVRDPLNTLVQDLAPIAILQSLFCAICLPNAGTWSSGTNDGGRNTKGSDSSTGMSKRTGQVNVQGTVKRRWGTPGTTIRGTNVSKTTSESIVGGPWQARVMPAILSLVLTITVPPVPLAALALMLGAPLYPSTIIPHTFALAMHVAILAFLPIFYTHGVSSTAWRDVAAAWLPFDEAGVWGGAVGTMVGGWVGAIPIALDWDREWQRWPCTVVWGAVVGWAVGRLLTTGLKVGIGARINLSVASSSPQDHHVVSESLEDNKKK